MADHKISGEFSIAPRHHLRRIPSLPDTEDSEMLFTVGVDYRFSINPTWPGWLKQTGPWVSLFYSYLPGEESTRNSTRHEIGGMVGYQQHISPYFFLLAAAGLGGAFNRLNFGSGALPELEESLNAHVDGRAGVELPLHTDFSVSLFGGYHYERSIAGDPEYFNRGWYGGLTFNYTIAESEKPHPPADSQ